MNQLRLNTRFIKVAGFRAVLFLWVILFGFTPYVQSQCTADAGRDTVLCINYSPDSAAVYLGGNPAASGGIPPYSYTWSTDYSLPGEDIYASKFLDDTTKANPGITFFGITDSITFYLTVTDSTGTTCNDSVVVQQCSYYFIPEGPTEITIESGETIEVNMPKILLLEDCPVTYEFYRWKPNYNMEDPYSHRTKVWPDKTTFYYPVYKSEAGCVFEYKFSGTFYVPLGAEKKADKSEIHISIYPNPLLKGKTATLNIVKGEELTGEEHVCFEIYNIHGQSVKTLTLNRKTTAVDIQDLPSGLYVYVVKQNNTILKRSKLHIIN